MSTPSNSYGGYDDYDPAGDAETRRYRPAPANYVRPPGLDARRVGQSDQPLSGEDRAAYLPQYRDDNQRPNQQQVQQQNQDIDEGPTLIAGRFDAKHVAVNLTTLAVLAGVVTFAAIIISDQLIGFASDIPARAPSEAVLPAILAALTGVIAGLLYIPTVGTGNENLFTVTIIALTVAGIVFYIFNDDLIDGNWQAISSVVAALAAGITASIAPPRIDAASVA